MLTTSLTLLQQLRERSEPQAWQRFVSLYTPLLLTWARRLGLQPADAADLVQDVFLKLVQEIPQFKYDPARSNFRGWLRTLCFNQWCDRQKLRATRPLPGGETALFAAPTTDDGLHDFWEHEHNAFLIRQALQALSGLVGEFEPQTLRAFDEVVVQRRPVAEVARELGVSENSVYVARFRVILRLREELGEFLE